MIMGRVNCHTDAPGIIAGFVLDPAFTTIVSRASSLRAGACHPVTDRPQPYTAPCASQQPTLASGCEGQPPARNKRRQGKRRVSITPRMAGNGGAFICKHGEICA